MFGLSLDIMHRLINDVEDAVRGGARFVAGQVSDEFLTGYEVTFRSVPAFQYAGHLGWANWLYKNDQFPVLQMIYPDRKHRWPWEPGVTEVFRAGQPILADISTPPLAE